LSSGILFHHCKGSAQHETQNEEEEFGTQTDEERLLAELGRLGKNLFYSLMHAKLNCKSVLQSFLRDSGWHDNTQECSFFYCYMLLCPDTFLFKPVV
jgi:hypothetical protein